MKTRIRNLIRLGVSTKLAIYIGLSFKGYYRLATNSSGMNLNSFAGPEGGRNGCLEYYQGRANRS